MMEIVRARRRQELQAIWGKFSGYAQTIEMFVLIDLIFERTLKMMSKKHEVFITVLTNIDWVKLTQPAEPIFSTTTLLMGRSCGRRRQSRLVCNEFSAKLG